MANSMIGEAVTVEQWRKVRREWDAFAEDKVMSVTEHGVVTTDTSGLGLTFIYDIKTGEDYRHSNRRIAPADLARIRAGELEDVTDGT